MNTITRTEMRAKTSKDRVYRIANNYLDIYKQSISCVQGQVRLCYNNKVDNISEYACRTRRTMNAINRTINQLDTYKSMVK